MRGSNNHCSIVYMLAGPTMHESITKYQSYLLRLWQESPRALWHASAQSVQTGEMLHFADLDTLVTFLWGQTTITHLVDRTQLDKGVKESITQGLTNG